MKWLMNIIIARSYTTVGLVLGHQNKVKFSKIEMILISSIEEYKKKYDR